MLIDTINKAPFYLLLLCKTTRIEAGNLYKGAGSMKISTKKLAVTALMLALCIVSQLFKNLSVYITGPIINLILLITLLYAGRGCAFVLSVITPITAFIITGSPIMAAMPIVMVAVMAGNAIYVWAFDIAQQLWRKMYISVAVASVAKGALMGVSISLLILPLLGPASGLPEKALAVAKTTFSVTQLICALVGGVIACIVWPMVKKAKHEAE